MCRMIDDRDEMLYGMRDEERERDIKKEYYESVEEFDEDVRNTEDDTARALFEEMDRGMQDAFSRLDKDSRDGILEDARKGMSLEELREKILQGGKFDSRTRETDSN